MKTYVFTATMEVDGYLEIDAESAEEAIEIVKEMTMQEKERMIMAVSYKVDVEPKPRAIRPSSN